MGSWRVSGLYTYRLLHAEYKQFPSFSAFYKGSPFTNGCYFAKLIIFTDLSKHTGLFYVIISLKTKERI